MVFGMRSRGLAVRWGTSIAASALFATVLVFVGALPRTTVPASPSAATTYLCSGYSGCRGAGYSDAGYGAVSGTMYWRMYSGHNCTNYAAYRVIKAGGPATRPWSGGGNASEWGLQMRSITDQVPNVGAIAWWARYDNGSGSAGHVAYVERVVSSSEIIISEDSWGGTFHWRRVTKSSGRWPTGFIHFTDKQLRQTTPAAVVGAPKVGEPLEVAPGAWTPAPTLRYQWLVDGATVAGATGRTFTPRPADVGRKVSTRITATRTGFDPVTTTATAATPVALGTLTPTAKPVISGEAHVGGTLTATAGAWAPVRPAMGWRWIVDGVWVRGNRTSTLPVRPEYDGKDITVVAVARRDGYAERTARADAPIGPILAGKVAVSSPITIKGGDRVGYQLDVVPGVYTPADVTASYQWLRDGVPIPGATRSRYVQTVADAGRTLSVRTTLSRDRYVPLTTTVSSRLTRTVPVVAGSPYGQRDRAVVFVRVTAPGITPVDGTVDVTVGGVQQSATLVDGRAKVAVEGVRTGERRVVVAYRGTAAVVARRWVGTVVVR